MSFTISAVLCGATLRRYVHRQYPLPVVGAAKVEFIVIHPAHLPSIDRRELRRALSARIRRIASCHVEEVGTISETSASTCFCHDGSHPLVHEATRCGTVPPVLS